MRSVMSWLALVGLCVAGAMAGEGYGAEPAPPAPPEPEPYADPMAEAADAMAEIMDEGAAPMEDAPAEPELIAEEEPAPEEPVPEEEPAAEEPAPEEEPAAEPEPEPEADAAPMEDAPEEAAPADAGYSDMAPEPAGTEAPAEEVAPAEEPVPEPAPMEEGGYRRAALKDARKRVFSWAKVKESDMFLVFDKTCRDNHKMCPAWASVVKGSRHPTTGKLVTKSECLRNSFMMTRKGCPLSCGVCTPSRRDWAVRRRLAMRKRALRLRNKNKNL